MGCFFSTCEFANSQVKRFGFLIQLFRIENSVYLYCKQVFELMRVSNKSGTAREIIPNMAQVVCVQAL
jgi:hypothetical protein